jgi:hypothetical protein
VLDLEIEKLGVREDVTAAAENPGGGIFLHRVAELTGESVEIADHKVGPRLFLYQAPSPYGLAEVANIRCAQIAIRVLQIQ